MKPLENIATDIKSDDPKAQRDGLRDLRLLLRLHYVSANDLLEFDIIPAVVHWISSHKQFAIVHTAMDALKEITYCLRIMQGEPARGLQLADPLLLELVQCLIDGLRHKSAFVPCWAAVALENLASCHGRVKDVIKECKVEDALAELQRNRVGLQCFISVSYLVQCLYDGRVPVSNFYSMVYFLTKERLRRCTCLEEYSTMLSDVTSDYISQIEGASTEDLVGILDSWLKLMEDFKDGACDPKHLKCIPLELMSLMRNTSEQVKLGALKCLTQYASVGKPQCEQVIDVGLFDHIGKHVFFVCRRQDTVTQGLLLMQKLVEKSPEYVTKMCAEKSVLTGLDFAHTVGSDAIQVTVVQTINFIVQRSSNVNEYSTQLRQQLKYSHIPELFPEPEVESESPISKIHSCVHSDFFS